MPYENVTRTVLDPLANAILQQWVYNHPTTFVKKEILSRIAHAALIPLSILAAATDISIGTVAAVPDLLTLGLCPSIHRFAARHLVAGCICVITRPYSHLLRTLNPMAPFPRPHIIDTDDGLIRGYVAQRLDMAVINARASDVFLIRHLATRGFIVLDIPVCIVTRVADGAIGLVAAVFSILTLGSIEAVNSFASKQLLTPVILSDSFSNVMLLINPWVIV